MIEKLQKMLPENTAAYIERPENRRYYTGFTSSNGFLFVTKNTAVFYTDFRYIIAARNTVDKRIEVRELDKNRYEIVADFVKKENITTVLIEENSLSYASAKKLEEAVAPAKIMPEGDGYTVSLRQIKTEKEIAKIKKAQLVADKGFDFLCKLIAERKTDLTEKEAAAKLEYFMKCEGADDLSFSVIAAFGENSACPHAVPTERKAKKGDALLFDYGAKVDGYCSDITRTVFLSEASEKQRNIYDIVLSAQKAALENIREGKTGAEIDRVARDIISSRGYGSLFGHSLGHSVGLDIHERPNYSPNEHAVIRENNVVTVEPGIYIENEFGVRIEDIAIVKRDGCEDITTAPKDFIII